MRLFFIILFLTFTQTHLSGQSYDWKDPLDFGFFDFGDNKLIGYNLLGLGLSEMLTTPNATKSKVSEVSISFMDQFRKLPRHTMLAVDYRWGKERYKFLSWGLGSRLYHVTGVNDQTGGVGAYAWFRWHVVKKRKWGISYDNGVGPNYFFNEFPAGGTKFNFTTYYAISVDFYLVQRWMSVQFTSAHLSNAGIKGVGRNPSYDAVGIRLVSQLHAN